MGDSFFAAGVSATKICPLHAQASSRCSATSLDSAKIEYALSTFSMKTKKMVEKSTRHKE